MGLSPIFEFKFLTPRAGTTDAGIKVVHSSKVELSPILKFTFPPIPNGLVIEEVMILLGVRMRRMHGFSINQFRFQVRFRGRDQVGQRGQGPLPVPRWPFGSSPLRFFSPISRPPWEIPERPGLR